MPTLSVSVPQRILDAAQTRLGRGRKSDVEKYVRNSLESLASANEPLDRETVEALRAGRQSTLIDVTDAYWASAINRLQSRAGKMRKKRSA